MRENLFITRKKGLVTAISNATFVCSIKKTLTLANIMASGVSTRKITASYAVSQGASIKTIMEQGDWAHTSTMYGHSTRCLPTEVLARIIKQISGSIQEVSMATMATDKALYIWSREEDMHPFTHAASCWDVSHAGLLGRIILGPGSLIFLSLGPWTIFRVDNQSQNVYSHILWEIWLP